MMVKSLVSCNLSLPMARLNIMTSAQRRGRASSGPAWRWGPQSGGPVPNNWVPIDGYIEGAMEAQNPWSLIRPNLGWFGCRIFRKTLYIRRYDDDEMSQNPATPWFFNTKIAGIYECIPRQCSRRGFNPFLYRYDMAWNCAWQLCKGSRTHHQAHTSVLCFQVRNWF